jgi:T-complex protein 1 subunit gamma
MLKMLLDPMGGIVLTNDGNAILREIDVAHPAAKSMIELARAQDEEVGDGTTSVIILAGEIMSAVEGFLERDIHPTVIVNAYFKALDEIVRITESFGVSSSCDINKAYVNRRPSTLRTRLTSRRSWVPASAPSSPPSGATSSSTWPSRASRPCTASKVTTSRST